jgi:hypothetical protein
VIDPDAAQRARESLDRQLTELAQLRNASRRDQGFRAWRQHTLTVIQRIWPDDARRIDRFRRIPFSPPMARATERQTREYYERGWGEAGVLLRGLIAEIDMLGLFTSPPSVSDAESDPTPATLSPPAQEPAGDSLQEAAAAAEAELDDLGRATERFLSTSPVFRGRREAGARPDSTGPREGPGEEPSQGPARKPDAPVLEPGTPAAELARLAAEVAGLGVPPEHADAARAALLALAQAATAGPPSWDLVSGALGHAAVSPALARRALPLLLPFIEKAA